MEIKNLETQVKSHINEFSLNLRKVNRSIAKKSLLLSIPVLLFCSCGGSETENGSMMPSDGQVAAKKQSSNAISQSMPSIMVFPSDAMLLRMGFLEEVENQGMTSYQRNYQEAFIKDPDIKFTIAVIQEQFSKAGFPLEDMEQQLKKIANDNAMDEMTGIARDLRAELLNTVRPDYIIEVDYDLKADAKSRNLNKSLTYSVRCLDAYTTKSVASVSESEAGKEMEQNDVSSIIKAGFANSMSDLKMQITNHYADLLANGVEVTLRVATTNESGIQLDDDCGDDEISEKINTWMKENTVNQSFKMSKNTGTEIYFTSVRIYAQDDNGNKYTAYDFASDLRKAIKNGCSIDVKNKTQSLGDALVVIEGER